MSGLGKFPKHRLIGFIIINCREEGERGPASRRQRDRRLVKVPRSTLYQDNERTSRGRTTHITAEFLAARPHNGISALSRNRTVASQRPGKLLIRNSSRDDDAAASIRAAFFPDANGHGINLARRRARHHCN